MSAVCGRCGAFKDLPMQPCPACGHRPRGEERVLAYLLSSHHLTDEELEDASIRIVSGEALDPPPELIERARSAISPTARELPEDPDEELPLSRVVGLIAANVVFSPLVGFVAWWSWRHRHPAQARQALQATIPVAVIGAITWLVLTFR